MARTPWPSNGGSTVANSLRRSIAERYDSNVCNSGVVFECEQPSAVWAAPIAKDRIDFDDVPHKLDRAGLQVIFTLNREPHGCVWFAHKKRQCAVPVQARGWLVVDFQKAIAGQQFGPPGGRIWPDWPHDFQLWWIAFETDPHADAAELLVNFVPQRSGLGLIQELRMLIAPPPQHFDHAVHRTIQEIGAWRWIQGVFLDGGQPAGHVPAIRIVIAARVANIRCGSRPLTESTDFVAA